MDTRVRRLYQIKVARDNVEVTGSARQAVVADSARWVINLDTHTGLDDQESGYAQLEKGIRKIAAYLASQGLTEYETPAVTSYPTYIYPDGGESIMTGFTVNRQIIVHSNEIERISELANTVEPLTGENYTVTTESVELTYSKLDELRVSLLSEAIKDAKARADAIAGKIGKSAGTLRSATSGVVQALPQSGSDINDCGVHDTQSKNKEVMVTVRTMFEL